MSSGSLLQGYDVVICRKCGFGFADHIPHQAEFDAYYRDMSKYEHQDRGGQESEYDLARFEAVASIIKPFLPNSQTRILEIGCATGRLLSLLKQSGYENVLGLDPSPICADSAHKLYGVRVLVNALSDIAIENQSIDFLILAGVLEHIRDLGAALVRLWNILSEGGRIYVAVPDASRYAQGEDAPFQDFSVEHINFFGPTSLTNLMHAHGFSQMFCQQRLQETSYRTTTPVIDAIYKKNMVKSSGVSIAPDVQTEPGLVAYINQSRQFDNHIRRIIDDIALNHQPIIVWGTGAHTLRLLATSRLAKANIRAFVDSNPRYQGKQLNGISIISPVDLRDRTEAIFISSKGFQSVIERQIRDELRLQNEIIKLYPIA